MYVCLSVCLYVCLSVLRFDESGIITVSGWCHGFSGSVPTHADALDESISLNGSWQSPMHLYLSTCLSARLSLYLFVSILPIKDTFLLQTLHILFFICMTPDARGLGEIVCLLWVYTYTHKYDQISGT